MTETLPGAGGGLPCCATRGHVLRHLEQEWEVTVEPFPASALRKLRAGLVAAAESLEAAPGQTTAEGRRHLAYTADMFAALCAQWANNFRSDAAHWRSDPLGSRGPPVRR